MHGEESFSSFDSITCLAFNIDVYNFDLSLCNYFGKEQVAGQGLLTVRIAKVQEKNFLFEKFRLLLK